MKIAKCLRTTSIVPWVALKWGANQPTTTHLLRRRCPIRALRIGVMRLYHPVRCDIVTTPDTTSPTQKKAISNLILSCQKLRWQWQRHKLGKTPLALDLEINQISLAPNVSLHSPVKPCRLIDTVRRAMRSYASCFMGVLLLMCCSTVASFANFRPVSHGDELCVQKKHQKFLQHNRNPDAPQEFPHTCPRRTPRPATALHSISNVVSGFQSLHGNPSYVLSVIFWLSTFGVSLERRTVIGKALSAPLATMALALATANLGLLPFESSICKVANAFQDLLYIFPLTSHVAFLLLVCSRLHDQSLFNPSRCTPFAFRF